MEINRIQYAPGIAKEPKPIESDSGGNAGKETFGQVFDRYLNGVNNQLMESEKLTTRLAAGEVNNLHEVTIAAQKASVALQLTVQVRDKALEAYQEMMRMQM